MQLQNQVHKHYKASCTSSHLNLLNSGCSDINILVQLNLGSYYYTSLLSAQMNISQHTPLPVFWFNIMLP